MTEQEQEQFVTKCEDCPETITVPNLGFMRTSPAILAAGWKRAGGFLRFRCPECARGM